MKCPGFLWALPLFFQQCYEPGTANVPILQMRRLRPGELESSVPKVTWPLGGNLYLAFHLSICPLPGSPPFLSPEALKPAPTGRPSLGLGCGRQSQPVYVILQGSLTARSRRGCSRRRSSCPHHQPQGPLSSQQASWRKGRGLPGLPPVSEGGVGSGGPRPHVPSCGALPAPAQVPRHTDTAIRAQPHTQLVHTPIHPSPVAPGEALG